MQRAVLVVARSELAMQDAGHLISQEEKLTHSELLRYQWRP